MYMICRKCAKTQRHTGRSLSGLGTTNVTLKSELHVFAHRFIKYVSFIFGLMADSTTFLLLLYIIFFVSLPGIARYQVFTTPLLWPKEFTKKI